MVQKIKINDIEECERYKILVTHPEVPTEAIDLLRSNVDVIMCESVPSNRDEILAKGKGVHGLFWATHDALNAEVLDAVGPQLKSISTMSAGIEYVDINEIQNRQIALGHTSTVLDNAVADLGIGLMIAAARRFTEGRKKIERYVRVCVLSHVEAKDMKCYFLSSFETQLILGKLSSAMDAG